MKKKLKELGISDPKTVTENAVDNVTKWPQVTLGVGSQHKERLTHLFLGRGLGFVGAGNVSVDNRPSLKEMI